MALWASTSKVIDLGALIMTETVKKCVTLQNLLCPKLENVCHQQKLIIEEFKAIISA